MADFCLECGIEVWGMDTGDLANISKPEDTAAGKYATVLCETCGPIQVDHTGRCISPFCEYHGKNKVKEHG